MITTAQPGATFLPIWATVKEILEENHPEELQNLQSARRRIGECSLEVQQSILRHALGDPLVPPAASGTRTATGPDASNRAKQGFPQIN